MVAAGRPHSARPACGVEKVVTCLAGELDTLERHQSRVTCHVSLATCGSPGHVHRVRVRGHGAAHAPLRLLEHAVPLGHGGELVADQSLLQLREHRHVEGAHPRVGLQRLVTRLVVST